MTVTVEANSLSKITQIASNPPRFPRNPAEVRQRSLTLYIARVPGTKDIILTTLKPLTKSVTAQDVITSLYYFHVNSDNEDLSPSKCSPKYCNDNDPNTTTRKPLPVNTSSNIKLDPAPASHNTKIHSIKRKPVAGSIPSTSIQPSSLSDQATPRRSLDPRISSHASVVERKSLTGVKVQNTELTKTISHPHLFPDQNSYDFIPKSSLGSENSDKPFSVTVIRRDPPSGAQWNIGVISGSPVIEEAPNGRRFSRPPKRPYYDLFLSLTTPGYTRLIEQGYIMDQNLHQSSGPDIEAPRESSSTFNRKITMEGSSFWSRASAQRKRALSDLSGSYDMSCGFRSQEYDRHQNDLVTQEKGYNFTSPWGGKCKFVTGGGGRSLRCHHKLPSPISANSFSLEQQSVIVSELRFNLPISLFAYSTALQSIGKRADFFSESQYNEARNRLGNLRFTKPPLTHRTRSNFASNQRSDDDERLVLTQSRVSLDSHERSHDRKMQTPKNSFDLKRQDSKEEDISQIYLDLGREKAGGGIDGKHAKLGKIIIHDEGLKMLDLIVSANMAVWWSVWNRS